MTYLDVESYAKRSARAEREDPPVYTLGDPVQLILDEPNYVLPSHLDQLSVQLTEPFATINPSLCGCPRHSGTGIFVDS